MDPILYNIREISEILKISEDRAYSLAREKILPSVRLGRTLRFSSKAIADFIENGGQALPGVYKREAE